MTRVTLMFQYFRKKVILKLSLMNGKSFSLVFKVILFYVLCFLLLTIYLNLKFESKRCKKHFVSIIYEEIDLKSINFNKDSQFFNREKLVFIFLHLILRLIIGINFL